MHSTWNYYITRFCYFTYFSNVHTVYAAEKYSDDASVDNKVNFNTDVIYQIVTDRFYDGDTANNPKNGMYDGNKKNLKNILVEIGRE